MSSSDFLVEPWKHPIPVATVPKPAPQPQQPPTLPQQPKPPDITQAIEARTDSLIIERLACKKGIALTPQPKNPKMRGLIDSMAKFNHEVDLDIENASKLIATAHTRRTEVFGKVKDHVSATVVDLNDMLANFDDLESAIGDNGAPSSAGDSQGSPVTSANSANGKAV